MRPARRSFIIAALCVASAALSALAQDFPAKQPVKLIVTFAPGGGSDTIARTLNTKMGEALGQAVIVENKAGAGGAIATDFVAKAPPDGYNVLFTVSSHSINQALVPTLPFNTERDLRGVTLIGATIAESGFPGFESDIWVGTFVPRATPDAVVAKLHAATLAALKDPAVAARMESQAGFVIGGSPAELDALVSREIRQFSQVVREQGLKPE